MCAGGDDSSTEVPEVLRLRREVETMQAQIEVDKQTIDGLVRERDAAVIQTVLLQGLVDTNRNRLAEINERLSAENATQKEMMDKMNKMIQNLQAQLMVAHDTNRTLSNGYATSHARNNTPGL